MYDLHKIITGIEILLKEKGYLWCSACDGWVKVEDDLAGHYEQHHTQKP